MCIRDSCYYCYYCSYCCCYYYCCYYHYCCYYYYYCCYCYYYYYCCYCYYYWYYDYCSYCWSCYFSPLLFPLLFRSDSVIGVGVTCVDDLSSFDKTFDSPHHKQLLTAS